MKDYEINIESMKNIQHRIHLLHTRWYGWLKASSRKFNVWTAGRKVSCLDPKMNHQDFFFIIITNVYYNQMQNNINEIIYFMINILYLSPMLSDRPFFIWKLFQVFLTLNIIILNEIWDFLSYQEINLSLVVLKNFMTPTWVSRVELRVSRPAEICNYVKYV